MTAKEYFEMCKRYWIGQGHNEAEASYRALWWDCKEVCDIVDKVKELIRKR